MVCGWIEDLVARTAGPLLGRTGWSEGLETVSGAASTMETTISSIRDLPMGLQV